MQTKWNWDGWWLVVDPSNQYNNELKWNWFGDVAIIIIIGLYTCESWINKKSHKSMKP